MLTAKDTELDKIVGLEIGADDYVTKPYSYRELLARLKAVLRRSRAAAPEPEPVLVAGGVRMDVERHEVRVDGEVVAMPLREFELLELFLRHPGRVLTRNQILERLWGPDYEGDTKTLDVHVKRLRGRIEADASKPVLITTVRGSAIAWTGILSTDSPLRVAPQFSPPVPGRARRDLCEIRPRSLRGMT